MRVTRSQQLHSLYALLIKGSLVNEISLLRTFKNHSYTTHHTSLIIHHSSIHNSSYTTHHTPLINTPLIIHHSSYTTDHTPLINTHFIIHHSSDTTHHTPLIIHHSSIHISSYTTHQTPLINTPLIIHHSSISRTLKCTRTAKQCGRAQSMVSQPHVNVDRCGNGRAQSAALLIGQVRVMIRTPLRANLTKATGKYKKTPAQGVWTPSSSLCNENERISEISNTSEIKPVATRRRRSKQEMVGRTGISARGTKSIHCVEGLSKGKGNPTCWRRNRSSKKLQPYCPSACDSQ